MAPMISRRASSTAAFTASEVAPGGSVMRRPRSVAEAASSFTSAEADAADAAACAAEAAGVLPFLMRTPSRPIEISMSPSSGRSILTMGSGFGAPAVGGVLALGGVGVGGLAGLGAGATVTVSLIVQVNGGSSLRMPQDTSSSTANTKKRFQLMPTSQLA